MRTRNAEKEELVKKMTLQMIVSNGFERFSVNSLAKACGISVATLYIYYKDKDDLIIQVAMEEVERLVATVFRDFDPEDSFATGLRKQWTNRAEHMLEYPLSVRFMEQLRSSGYHQRMAEDVSSRFRDYMKIFVGRAIQNGELKPMPVEVLWSVAFSPLYSLLRFHHDGSSIGGKPFVISQEIIWQTFDLVLKALKP